jgi:hypothetical protein
MSIGLMASPQPEPGTADWLFLAIGYWLSAISTEPYGRFDILSYRCSVAGVVIDPGVSPIDRKR